MQVSININTYGHKNIILEKYVKIRVKNIMTIQKYRKYTAQLKDNNNNYHQFNSTTTGKLTNKL